ncbi:LOW QUALITY PROTEIN: hypothetical protein CVT26_004112 [Gymnopilus dilepis]|uniref:Uncharacterized protein n=1 Tax=Gymnopilus dilepis TaxID=231916 RepID=A0A409YV70_9AGAR|nr:LOW QUALITY PROTEIN: hypothetical protein CVT26_004112 [Gymnopilus dilepis]
MSNPKVIDDQGSSVQYSPGWILSGTQYEYNWKTSLAKQWGLTATLNFTELSNLLLFTSCHLLELTASFDFQGTGIKVLGTIPQPSDYNNSPSIKSSYAVDDSQPQIYTAVIQSVHQYHFLLFRSPSLPYGEHTLLVQSLKNSGTNSTYFILDYFQILNSTATSSLDRDATTSPHILVISTALLGGIVLFGSFAILVFWCRRRRRGIYTCNNSIDDRDPSVVYSPGWQLTGTQYEFDNTTSLASQAGLKAEITFMGTGIRVIGTIPNGQVFHFPSVVSSYVLDESAPWNYTAIEEPAIQYRVIFYRSPPLSYGSHNLTVNSLGSSNDTTSTWLVLDYFEVINGSAPTSMSSTLPPSTSSLETASQPSSTRLTSTNPSDSRTLVISTAILGGVVLLSWLAFLIIWYRRRTTTMSSDVYHSPTQHRSRRAFQAPPPPPQSEGKTYFEPRLSWPQNASSRGATYSNTVSARLPSTPLSASYPFSISPISLRSTVNIDGTDVETECGTLQRHDHIHQSGCLKYSIEKDDMPKARYNHGSSDTPIAITRVNSVSGDKRSTQQTMILNPTFKCPRTKSDTKNRSADGTVKDQGHQSKGGELRNTPSRNYALNYTSSSISEECALDQLGGMNSTKIIDDRDPSVQYSPGWAKHGVASEYNSTTSLATSPGLTASLTFTETGIMVFGTIPPTATGISPVSSYVVDNSLPQNYTGIQLHQPMLHVQFFQNLTLPYGKHSLEITDVGTADSFLYLDYFVIVGIVPPSTAVMSSTPSKITVSESNPDIPDINTSTSSCSCGKAPQSSQTRVLIILVALLAGTSMNDTKTVDDQDASVQYSPGWEKGGIPPEYDNTTSRADVPGLTAALNFTGTAIKVFGTITHIGEHDATLNPMSSYVVDNLISQNYTGILRPDIQYQVLFFQSLPLPYGPHTLRVTNIGTVNASLFLDYFEIVGVAPAATTLMSSDASGPSMVTVSEPSGGHKSTLHTLIIAVALLGGLVGLGLFSCLIIWCRRWRTQRTSINNHLHPFEYRQVSQLPAQPVRGSRKHIISPEPATTERGGISVNTITGDSQSTPILTPRDIVTPNSAMGRTSDHRLNNTSEDEPPQRRKLTTRTRWRITGTTNEFDDTTSLATEPGLTASLNFTGTGIKVVGTIPNTPLVLASGPFVNSSYAVDGSAPQNYAALTQSGIQYGIIFFQSVFLSYGNHNLVVTSLGNSSGTFLVLDYFEVIGSPASTTIASDSNNFPVDIHITTLHIMIILTALLGGLLVIGLSWLMIMRHQRRRTRVPLRDTPNNTPTNRQVFPREMPRIRQSDVIPFPFRGSPSRSAEATPFKGKMYVVPAPGPSASPSFLTSTNVPDPRSTTGDETTQVTLQLPRTTLGDEPPLYS